MRRETEVSPACVSASTRLSGLSVSRREGVCVCVCVFMLGPGFSVKNEEARSTADVPQTGLLCLLGSPRGPPHLITPQPLASASDVTEKEQQLHSRRPADASMPQCGGGLTSALFSDSRSEEHTSELQSR